MAKKLLLIVLLLSGCANMTPGQKKGAWIAAGIVVASIAIVESQRSHSPASVAASCYDIRPPGIVFQVLC